MWGAIKIEEKEAQKAGKQGHRKDGVRSGFKRTVTRDQGAIKIAEKKGAQKAGKDILGYSENE